MFNTRAKYYKVDLRLSTSYQQEIVVGYFLLAHRVVDRFDFWNAPMFIV